MKSFAILCLVSCILFFIGCEKSTTPITTTRISLTAEYIGVTEAELSLQVDSSQPYDALQLLRDGQLVLSAPLSTSDTTLLDTTLLPAHTYTYQAALFQNNRQSSKSNEITLTTMDTTSHDFQWEIFTIESPFGSGMLNDVAIINENDIWAVGEIYADSTEPWLIYNAVHWDGQQWELKRIPFTGWCSAVEFPPIRSIFAFSKNDIWFARGGSLVHYNGNSFFNDCNMNALLAGSIKKIWGTDSNNIFIVGGSGTIVHYDGSIWQRIESGTDLPIQDIWGILDWKTGEENIFAVASEKYTHSENNLLKINQDNTVSDIPWPYSANRDPYSLWFHDSYSIFICGDGVVKRNRFGQFKLFKDLPKIFENRIRGNDINDIIVVGDFGLVAYFNGVNWKVIDDPGFGKFLSVAYKGDIAVAVGEKNSNAIIAMLIRNK